MADERTWPWLSGPNLIEDGRWKGIFRVEAVTHVPTQTGHDRWRIDVTLVEFGITTGRTYVLFTWFERVAAILAPRARRAETVWLAGTAPGSHWGDGYVTAVEVTRSDELDVADWEAIDTMLAREAHRPA